jgi:MATE family multidrug resistance protein
VDAFGRILGFALRGAGATRLVTVVAFVLQWGVQLPLAWFIGVHLGFGLLGMAISWLLLFAAETIIVTIMWRNGFWSPIVGRPEAGPHPADAARSLCAIAKLDRARRP